MGAITGTIKGGLIILDQPTGLPDGSRVVIEPLDDRQTFGVRESDWRDTPEAIADWIAWCNSLEPIETSVADEQSLQACRQNRKDVDKSAFEERAERLRGIWE